MMKYKENFRKTLKNWLSWKKRNSTKRNKLQRKKCSKTGNKDTRTSLLNMERPSNSEFYKTKPTETNWLHFLDGIQPEILQVLSLSMSTSKR